MLSILKGKRKTFGNLAGHVQGMDGIKSLAQWTNEQFDPRLNWKDVEWIRDLWRGKLIIKGILDIDDAKRAAKTGASALVVSNHGGRQLDGAPSSIAMLPKIVDAVGSDIEFMFDGGIRTGADILRALALGARSCMIGRAYVYGLGANGEAGVAKAIDILKKELDVSMALTGVKSIDEIGPQVLADFALRNSSPTRTATQAALDPSFLLQPQRQRVARRAVIFVRQELPVMPSCTRSPLGSALRVMSMSKSIADMMPSPNSSSISTLNAGPLTMISS